jgi:hypothetical protein
VSPRGTEILQQSSDQGAPSRYRRFELKRHHGDLDLLIAQASEACGPLGTSPLNGYSDASSINSSKHIKGRSARNADAMPADPLTQGCAVPLSQPGIVRNRTKRIASNQPGWPGINLAKPQLEKHREG